MTSEYVYFAGRRIARRDAGGNVFYYVEDLLGSSRTIVQAGQTTACYDADFYPYGGERVYTNTCVQHYKFMSHERDAESGLDDFGARYFSSQYGRFLSADWSAIPVPVPYANFTNPQTLNLYAIVHDNPESFADLDGHVDADNSGAGSPGTPTNPANQAKKKCEEGGSGCQPAPPAEQPAQQQNDQQQNASKLDKGKFVNYMDQNAKNKSTGFCAMACRKGLAAGGLNTSGHPGDAKDYGPFLVKNGASVVPGKNYKPEKGDIVVFEGNKSHPYGHIEVYNGKGWVSDFKQHSMIPYRSDVPPHTIYRFPNDQ